MVDQPTFTKAQIKLIKRLAIRCRLTLSSESDGRFIEPGMYDTFSAFTKTDFNNCEKILNKINENQA